MVNVGDFLFKGESGEIWRYVILVVFIFAILYGILEKIKMFKDKKVNAIISAVVALLTVSFGFANDCISSLVLILVLTLVVAFVAYFFIGILPLHGKDEEELDWPKYAVGAVSFVMFIIFLISFESCGLADLSIRMNSTIIGGAAILIIILIIVMSILKGKESELRPAPKKIKKPKPVKSPIPPLMPEKEEEEKKLL